MVLTTDSVYERIARSLNMQGGLSHYYRLTFQAMGTRCSIDYKASPPSAATTYKENVCRWLAEFEARYSRYISKSLISKINQNAGKAWVEIDKETEKLFQLCDWYYWLTQGLFDPSALPLIHLWDYKMKHITLPEPQAVERIRASVNWENVQREEGKIFLPKKGMAIDLRGIGKEYAVDRAIEIAFDHGIKDILIDFGADMRMHGNAPQQGAWVIGLEHPKDPGRCWGGVALKNRAIASSGDYLRHIKISGKHYGHIINPHTGYPVANGSLSVSVIAPTCTEAGILSTTAFRLGQQKGWEFIEHYHQAEGCIWTNEYIIQTGGFNHYELTKMAQ